MALSCSLIRSFNRNSLQLWSCRNLYTSRISNTSLSLPRLVSSQACETFEQKNERLKRPLSPHLTIYDVQLTSLLSITHRTTGIILASYAVTLGSTALFVPGGVNCLIQAIDAWCLPSVALYTGKYLLALPVTFHFFNGIRHLLWDLGMFLTIKEVYSTGYAVAAASILTAIGLSAM